MGGPSLMRNYLYLRACQKEPLAANRGERLTEFGEKPVDARVDPRARWYF